MNTLTIVIVAIFLIFMLLGLKRGLFKTAFRMVSMVIALVLAYFVAPIVTDLIIQNTNVDEYIEQKVDSTIRKDVEERVSKEAESVFGPGSVTDDVKKQLTDAVMQTELTRNEQIEAINEFNIPNFLKDNLIANNHEEMKNLLGVNNFYDYVEKYISRTVINAVSFMMLTVILALVLFILSIVVSVALELPIVGSINRIGGMAFGFFEALFIVWLLFVVFAAIANTEFGVNMYNQIEESKMLKYIYDKDLFLNVLTKLNK